MTIEQYPSSNNIATTVVWKYTATGSELTLSGYDNYSQALNFTTGSEQVYLNGVLLVRNLDYTPASNGLSITFPSNLAYGDFVQIYCYSTYNISTVSSSSITGNVQNAQLANSTITFGNQSISLGGTLTNLTGLSISGSTNTLTNIPNSALSNSSIIINGNPISLGGTVNITTPNTLLPNKGDIIIGTGGGSATNLPIGTNNQTLLVDSTQTTGLKWAASLQSSLSAKGSLISASAANTPVELPVGADGTTLVANSANASGLGWAGNQAAGKNTVINGNFDWFQRGSFTSQTANGYNLDRWYCSLVGTVTITQQTTGVPNGSKYCGRVAYNAATSVGNLYQALESGTVAQLQGQNVTLQAKLRRNSTFAANLQINIYKNATADTLTGGSWTLVGTTTVSNANLPTGTTAADWYLATLTVAIPNDGTANGIRVSINETATGASGAYWEVAQVQLELGSNPTTFTRAGGTLQGELSACQRYTCKLGGGSVYGQLGSGYIDSPTAAKCVTTFPVQMRVPPTATNVGGNWLAQLSGAVTFVQITNPNVNGTETNFSGSSMTTGRGTLISSNNDSNTYLIFSAEL